MPAAKSKASAIWDAIQPWVMGVLLPATGWLVSLVLDLRQDLAVLSERTARIAADATKLTERLEKQDDALREAAVVLATVKESVDGLRKLRDVDHP